MSTALQFRRGSAAQNNAFVGANGEITVDVTGATLRLHDGATAGGSTLATAAQVATNATAISNEVTRATGVESTNAAAIAAEVSARGTAVSAETARALAAEAVALGGIGRNRIHNGSFGINQRAQVSGVALAAGIYGHDRWKAGAGGCTYSFTQTQPTTIITITAGTLQQVIEGLNVEGGSYTLSWGGSATARIGSGSYVASPITITGLTVNQGITVEFGTGTVDRVQFEPGVVATPFARRSYRYELAECQRFYQSISVNFWSYGQAAGTNGQTIGLPVSMRAAPTVTIPTPTLTNLTGLTALGGASGQTAVYGTVTATGPTYCSANITLSADL